MKKHYRHENDCLNCGTILEGKYCHNCGQENLEVKESFGHMMNHAISDYFHFDHQFFHTLKPLLFKPGYLTNEYMAGRRVQYLHPVKMYIFISVVYFLLLFQSGSNLVKINGNNASPAKIQKSIDSLNKEITNDHSLTNDEKKTIKARIVKYSTLGARYSKNGSSKSFNISGDSTVKQYTDHQNKLPPAKRDGFWERTIDLRLIAYHQKYGERSGEVFNEELQHNLPKMMFVLLPLFALILAITFQKNKKFYVEHLIYAFHLHCFIFLFSGIIILFEFVIPNSWNLSDWLLGLACLYTLWYIYKSLRAVYHRSPFRTITKLTGMLLSYFMVYFVCFTILLLITAMTVS